MYGSGRGSTNRGVSPIPSVVSCGRIGVGERPQSARRGVIRIGESWSAARIVASEEDDVESEKSSGGSAVEEEAARGTARAAEGAGGLENSRANR